jgi:LPXTG-site transpeptidase (sortase) family protein
MKKKKNKILKFLKSKLTIILICLGTLLILAGIGNAVYLYVINHSPFDVVDTTVEDLDKNNNFIPLVQPKATNTLEPIPIGTEEIQNGQELPDITPTSQDTEGSIPDRIVIPAINLDAPVVPIHAKVMHLDDQVYEQWLVPNKFAAGWHETSALLGLAGNTVLNGHHNVFGKVFQYLVTLQAGDLIEVYSGSKVFMYRVDQKLLLPERFQTLEKRAQNAQWIMPTTDERLTLVTCWPADSNTHRVIIVAFPVK